MYILGQIWVQLCPFYFCIFRLLSASTPPYSQPQLAGSQNLFCKRPSSKNTNLFKLRPYLEEIWVKENNQRQVHSWSITWGGRSVHTGPGTNAQGRPSLRTTSAANWATARPLSMRCWAAHHQQYHDHGRKLKTNPGQLHRLHPHRHRYLPETLPPLWLKWPPFLTTVNMPGVLKHQSILSLPEIPAFFFLL